LFEIAFGIPGWIVMLALATITALYLFFGGYFATALSDFIQGIIMLIGVILMLIFFINAPEVNWKLDDLNWFTFSSKNTGLYGDTVSLISLILLTSFGVWALPQTIHKYHTVRDAKAINQGMIVSTIFALVIGFGAYFVGGLSTKFSTLLGSNFGTDNAIPIMLDKIIPVGVMGIIAVLILSASMSTLSSVSLSSASVVAIDLYKGKINVNADDRKVNILMKVLCLVFILISVLLAVLNAEFGIAAIAYMMGLSWGALAGCFIGPYVLGVVWKRVSKPAVWVSMVGSLILTFALTVLFGFDKLEWSCSLSLAIKTGISCSPMVGVICMAYSMISTILVSLFTKQPRKDIIDEAFDKKIDNLIV
jgi:SSS family solute:Na+ symporter/sodium/proline symporter